jgi:hypothetical protein
MIGYFHGLPGEPSLDAARIVNHDRGMVLFTALLFVLIMSILGAIACVVTSNDAAIVVNLEVSRKAFYSAEAGVNFAIKSIEADIKTHTLNLPSTDGDVISLSSYTLPSDEDITDIHFEYLPIGAPVLMQIAENLYQFTVRGYGSRNADADISVTVRNDTAFKYGVFGDQGIESSEYMNYSGYDSTETLTPYGDDGSNQCHIGSNGRVSLSGNTEVHGYIGLGNNGTTDAVYTPTGNPGPLIYADGDTVRSVGRITADPLGVIDGAYAQIFGESRVYNDNGMIPSQLILETGQSVTLKGKPGGADYYFTKVELKKGAGMSIDTSAGPVNIYLSGDFNGKSGTITHAGGDPKKFAIFSDTADPISLSHTSPFYGIVYAPYADLQIFNRSSIYGAVLARTVEMKNAGVFYFDSALKNKYLTKDVIMASWLDVRR